MQRSAAQRKKRVARSQRLRIGMAHAGLNYFRHYGAVITVLLTSIPPMV